MGLRICALVLLPVLFLLYAVLPCLRLKALFVSLGPLFYTVARDVAGEHQP